MACPVLRQSNLNRYETIISKGRKMTTLIRKKTITHSSLDETSVKPIERAYLKSADLEKGLDFFNGRCRILVANQLRLRQEAYRLLYDLYFKMGITKKKDNELWLSIYDALPETTTFVAENDQGRTVGALTVVFDSPIGLPADELYKKEIDELRDTGRRVCEFVSLGVRNNRKNSIKYLASLFYCAFLHAWQREDSLVLVITVHSRYENFYHRKLSFEKIGPERNYAKVRWAPTVLLGLSLAEINLLRRKRRIFPFFMLNLSDQEELEHAQRIQNLIRPISDEEFITFFIEKTDIWKKSTPHQKDFIKQRFLHRAFLLN
jgi:hypothetical protein